MLVELEDKSSIEKLQTVRDSYMVVSTGAHARWWWWWWCVCTYVVCVWWWMDGGEGQQHSAVAPPNTAPLALPCAAQKLGPTAVALCA